VGVSGGHRKNEEPLESVTSGRMEAVRYYSLGKKALYAGHYGQAEKLMRHALDENFAMAYAYLGVISFNQDQDLDGRQYLRKAMGLSTGLTERERYKILGTTTFWSPVTQAKPSITTRSCWTFIRATTRRALTCPLATARRGVSTKPSSKSRPCCRSEIFQTCARI